MLLKWLSIAALAFLAPIIAQPGAARASEVGLNISNIYYDGAHGISPGILDAIKRSGASWVRISLYWGWTVEKNRGQFDWSGLDAGINALRAAHINVLMIINGPVPCWALPELPAACPRPLQTVPDIGAWQSFVATAAKRFKGRVSAWEIWNEPDLVYSIARPDITDGNRLSLYRDYILLPAARAIRGADPGAKIVAGALSVNFPATAPQPKLALAIRAALDGVPPALVDALSIHVYSPFDLLTYGRTARSTLDAIGYQGKPIWLTETGIAEPNPTGELSEAALASQKAFVTGPLTAAARSGLYDKIFWFALTDSNDTNSSHADGYGVVANGYNEKTLAGRPAFDALRALALPR